jgi:MFS family permease
MAGPALGGFICAYNIPLAYVVTGLCWFTTSLIVWLIPNREPPRRGAPATLPDVAAGLRFVWRTKLLLGAMTLDLFAVLLGGVLFLLPIFATRIGGGAVTLGWFRAAVALGAACMAIGIAHFPPFRRAGRVLLFSVCIFGAATIAFGFSTNFWFSFAMLALVGASDNVSVVIRHSLMQLLTPDEMRGRVAAINQIFIGSSNELGGLRAGVMAAFFGEVISVVAGGIGTILVVFGVASLWPQVARLGSLKEIRPAQASDPTSETSPAPATAAGN